jgi:hypothetical protein
MNIESCTFKHDCTLQTIQILYLTMEVRHTVMQRDMLHIGFLDCWVCNMTAYFTLNISTADKCRAQTKAGYTE